MYMYGHTQECILVYTCVAVRAVAANLSVLLTFIQVVDTNSQLMDD